jgi:hypothetical protein
MSGALDSIDAGKLKLTERPAPSLKSTSKLP